MDHESFTELVGEHKDVVYALALHLCGSREDAEDVVQDAFLAYWRHGDGVPREAARPWLLRVCRNACIDRLRRTRARRTELVGLIGEERLGSHELALSDGGREAGDVESSAAFAEIVRVLGALDEPGRSVVILRDVLDLTYEAIASTMDMSLPRVKVTLHRARRRLRARLEIASQVQP
jgi:RNA polymerase sigma-70 factor (ECF subfamily)